MYSIVDVVVGTPLTQDVHDALERLGIEPEEVGYEVLYSGSGDVTPGYCGVRIDGFDECNDSILLSTLKTNPTAAQLKKAKELFKKLPDDIKKVAPPVDVHLVFSTS